MLFYFSKIGEAFTADKMRSAFNIISTTRSESYWGIFIHYRCN